MIRINDIIDQIMTYNPDADISIIERAYIYSAKIHEGKPRLYGEPYLAHPLEVAAILADMKLDTESIVAGLLHDVIENSHTESTDEIKSLFGESIANIVAGVTKISRLPFDDSKIHQAENLRSMILAMSNDIRIILVKLADRLHTMRNLKYIPIESQESLVQETLDIYSAIAARLGIFWIKNELQDMSFKYLQPKEYEKIRLLVCKGSDERENYIEKVSQQIKQKMEDENLSCVIKGRFKQFYSIYKKMISQNIQYEDVYDIMAFRIILNTVSECYKALGIIHSLWPPIAKKIKDYIAMPKPNMYQSLHTTVIGPNGERVEIQIRTQDMDKIAESGIAAHWSYKEGQAIDEKTGKEFAWIKNLVENYSNWKDPNEFLENVKIDLYPDEIYVFSPNGDIKTLPKGSTPIDFAYMIHSDIGHKCIGAKVNSRIVPLSYKLKTGDTVRIITSNMHKPSNDWLNFVRTSKARSKIRQWIRTQEKERSISLGKEMCEKAFKKYRLSFNEFLKSDEIDNILKIYGFNHSDDLIANIGYGKITPLQIIRKLIPEQDPEPKELNYTKYIPSKKIKDGIIVKGLHDILVRFGKCCNPVPGDSIIGYITQGHGITVHRTNCINVLSMNSERKIDVSWNEDFTETYPVKIRVRSKDRVGLLADITSKITKTGANILGVNSEAPENKVVDIFFTLSVKDTEQLKKVITAIKRVRKVQNVKRLNR